MKRLMTMLAAIALAGSASAQGDPIIVPSIVFDAPMPVVEAEWVSSIPDGYGGDLVFLVIVKHTFRIPMSVAEAEDVVAVHTLRLQNHAYPLVATAYELERREVVVNQAPVCILL